MAYKQKGSPFQRNFGIGSPAKQTLQPRVAPVAAPMAAPPQAPPIDPAMIAQAAEAVKGAMAPPPPPVDPGAEMPPPTQRNLRMEAESPVKFIGRWARSARARRAARPKTARTKTHTSGTKPKMRGGNIRGISISPEKLAEIKANKPEPTTGGANRRGRTGGRRRGLFGGLARGVKSMGKAVRGSVGSGMSGIAKTAKVVKGASNLAKGVR